MENKNNKINEVSTELMGSTDVGGFETVCAGKNDYRSILKRCFGKEDDEIANTDQAINLPNTITTDIDRELTIAEKSDNDVTENILENPNATLLTDNIICDIAANYREATPDTDEVSDVYSPVDPNEKDDRSPEEILRDNGFEITSIETVKTSIYTTSNPSIVSRLTDDLPHSPYEWISLEGMIHERTFVPEELKKMKIWICRCGKRCYSPNGKYPIGPTEVNECVTYDEAIAAAEKYGHDGVSIMLMESNDIWCVDIDDCNKDGKIHPVAWSIIQKLNSFTELSTSGSGFHIYILADKKDRLGWDKKKENALEAGIDLEIYPNKRHIVSTRRTMRGFEHLRRADKELEEIYNAYMAPTYKKSDDGVISEPPPPMTAEEVLEHLRKDKNGAKFIQALTSGDLSGFDTDDRSSIDFSIVSKLTFYTITPGIIRKIMLNSPIRRDKWDSMRSNVTYLDYIIAKALQRCKQHYHPSEKTQQDSKKKSLSLQALEDNFNFDFDTLANVDMNMIALSEFFGQSIKDIVRYSPFDRSFFIYNGVIWDNSNEETVMADIAKRFIKHCLDVCSMKIKTIQNKIDSKKNDKNTDKSKKNGKDTDLEKELDEAYKLYSFYQKLSTLGSRQKLIADVKNEIVIDHEKFDSFPYLFNLPNGTFNLNTLELQPHRADDYLTQVAAADYNPKAECPRFLKFVDEITLNREHIKRYLQKACGYLLSGTNELHCMFIIFGSTSRNGKSTTFTILRDIMKDYAVTCDVDMITKPSGKGGGSPKPELLQLYKKRFAYFEEPDKYSTLQGSLIKQITGGTQLSARGLFSNKIQQFRCFAKMVMSCNNLPRINDLSQIKSNRLKIIPFDRYFAENERDLTLVDEFSTPEAMSSILNWMIDGYKMYKAEGLKPFEEMKDILKNYESSYDIYSQFIKERLILRNNGDSDLTDSTQKSVWEEGKLWMKECNYRMPSRQEFFFELEKNGVKSYTKNHQNYIRGMVIKSEELYSTRCISTADVKAQEYLKGDENWRRPS